MRIVLLGGAGYFCRTVINDFSSRLPDDFEYIIADYDYRTARKMAKVLGKGFSAMMTDVSNPFSFEKTARESSLVVSFVGPWYRFGEGIIEGSLRVKKPMIISNPDSIFIDDAKRRWFEDSGITCVTGVSLWPGGINLLADDLCARYQNFSKAVFTLSIDTAKYGGLGFIREYFSLISGRTHDHSLEERKYGATLLFQPKGFFQKIASSGKTGNRGIRIELLSTFQDMLRKKPRPGRTGGISLALSMEGGDEKRAIEIGGDKIFPLLTGMLVGATHAALKRKEGGIISITDLKGNPEFRKYVDKDLQELFI